MKKVMMNGEIKFVKKVMMMVISSGEVFDFCDKLGVFGHRYAVEGGKCR